MRYYDHERYWDGVATEVDTRETDGRHELAAGDDMPLYAGQDTRALQALGQWSNGLRKTSLLHEFGCGPGGDLKFLHEKGYQYLSGFDTSHAMLSSAKRNCPGVRLLGTLRALRGQHHDAGFSVTTLQHVVDPHLLATSIDILCSVTEQGIFLIEDVSKTVRAERTWVGRPAADCCGILNRRGFELVPERSLGTPFLECLLSLSTL
jgi:SAM-dependent methyltransferase